jgi:hypothetical protein
MVFIGRSVMTLSDEQRAVGREGIIQANGFEVSVIIRDVRLRPKAVDYLIEPTAGMGKIWIDADHVRIVGRSE